MTNFMTQISTLLTQAREAGATPAQMATLKRGFQAQYDWNPTKKQLSAEQRKKKRNMQKQSRKINRGKK